MGAWSDRTYVLLKTATRAGLCFEYPPWWDVEALFAKHARWQVALSDGRQALLLSWAHLLTWSKQEQDWVEQVPQRVPPSEGRPPQKADVLRALQQARWVILCEGRVWVVPKEAGNACAIFRGPWWWDRNTLAPEYLELYAARYIDTNNPFWMDSVRLFSGDEARAMDKVAREGYRAYCREFFGRGLRRPEIQEMARFSRALKRAEWVVIYTYEWESGLD